MGLRKEIPVDFDTHKALELPKSDRVAYLKVIASLAAADGVIGAKEIAHLQSVCEEFGLQEDETAAIVATAQSPEQAEIVETIESLKGSPLRFTLLADLTFAAYADGRYTKDERIEIVEVSQLLDTTYDQLVAIDRHVEAKRKKGTVAAVAGLKGYLGISWLASKLPGKP
jgi:uncharacterized tellurite resistance protein B-like protein